MGDQELEEEEEEKGREGKWLAHYSSNHQILLVGEGDFSFSLCLATSFGSASNICASSLVSKECSMKKYKKSKSNLEDLEKLGAYLLHEVDATKMKLHPDLSKRKFDRIVFNFPHAGFYGKEDNALLINMHRDLVQGFFRNAKGMLRANGEIHVNHKMKKPFSNWNIEELGRLNSLSLIQIVRFRKEDYPGYNNKRGHGVRCDDPFFLGESCTFKFGFSPGAKKLSQAITGAVERHHQPQRSQDILVQVQPQQQPIYSNFNYHYPHKSLIYDISHIPLHAGSAVIANMMNGSTTRIRCAIHKKHQPSQGNPMQRNRMPLTSEAIYPQRHHIPLKLGSPCIVHREFGSLNRTTGQVHIQPELHRRIPIQEQLGPTYSDFISSVGNRMAGSNHVPEHVGLSSILNKRESSFSMFGRGFNHYHVHPKEMEESVMDRIRDVGEGVRHHLERQGVEVRQAFEDELYHLSVSRSKMVRMQ